MFKSFNFTGRPAKYDITGHIDSRPEHELDTEVNPDPQPVKKNKQSTPGKNQLELAKRSKVVADTDTKGPQKDMQTTPATDKDMVPNKKSRGGDSLKDIDINKPTQHDAE